MRRIRSILAAIAVAISIVALAAGPANAYPIGASIFNPASGRCVGISNGLAGIWDCTGNADQMWHWEDPRWTEYSITWFNIVNGRGECLAVAGADPAPGAQVVGFNNCAGTRSADQLWATFHVLGSIDQLTNLNGYRRMQQGQRGGFLGVAGGATNNGARVVQWYQDYSENQKWMFLEDPPQ